MNSGGLDSDLNVPSSQQSNSSQPVESQPVTDSKSSDAAEEPSAEADSGDSSTTSEDRELRLAKIKAQIDAGEYDTPDKLEAALGRLFDEIVLEEEDG